MSNINVFERLFKLWGKISMLIMDGKRDPEMVAERLQMIVTEPSLPYRLKSHDTIKCPAFERFEAKGKFGRGVVGGVKFRSLGNNFTQMFSSKVEINIHETILCSRELLMNSNGLQILRQIEDGKELISLAHLHHLLTLQSEGQEGILLTDGLPNIFHIVGADGEFSSMNVYWSVVGWDIKSGSIGDLGYWCAGSRVFSR
ncbi:MAG: hypothetical protein KBC33_01685 [Candidatus Pacebacteria bacterium]|nr:hypothetical protein [Candidatus Paceibacterota bacterium]